MEDFAYNSKIPISTYLETLIKQKWFQVELDSGRVFIAVEKNRNINMVFKDEKNIQRGYMYCMICPEGWQYKV